MATNQAKITKEGKPEFDLKNIITKAKIRKEDEEVIELIEEGSINNLEQAREDTEDKVIKEMITLYLMDIVGYDYLVGMQQPF